MLKRCGCGSLDLWRYHRPFSSSSNVNPREVNQRARCTRQYGRGRDRGVGKGARQEAARVSAPCARGLPLTLRSVGCVQATAPGAPRRSPAALSTEQLIRKPVFWVSSLAPLPMLTCAVLLHCRRRPA